MKSGLEAIPNKLYFRIGEVSDLVGVKPYVLRYWESEFPDIKPSKSKSGQRLYKRRDVEMLLKIKELLYQERFTINGAKKRLKDVPRNGAGHKDVPSTLEHDEEGVPEVVAAKPPRVEVVIKAPTEHPVQAPAMRDSPAAESRKLLLKLRKDLEQLLAVIHE